MTFSTGLGAAALYSVPCRMLESKPMEETLPPLSQIANAEADAQSRVQGSRRDLQSLLPLEWPL